MATSPPHRKKLRRIEQPYQPRFVTCSCVHRLALFDNDAITDAFVDQLRLTRTRLCFRLLAWVIMSEHFHAIIVPGQHHPMASILMALKRPFSAHVLQRWRALNAPILSRLIGSDGAAHFWQAGGEYDRNLDSIDELTEKTNYCHTNPQARGLVELPTDWPWSSARWYAGWRDMAMLEIDEFAFS